jgi:hypothetical protein
MNLFTLFLFALQYGNNYFSFCFQVRTLLTANKEESRLTGIVVSDMQWLVQFLSTFKIQTDRVQGENYPTLPFALLATRKLKDHCQPVPTDTPLQAIFRARVSRAVARKLSPSITQKMATFLWPQYRHLLMLSESERDEVTTSCFSSYY